MQFSTSNIHFLSRKELIMKKTDPILQVKHKQSFTCPSPDTSILHISSLPDVPQWDRINAFYQKISQLSAAHCERTLTALLDGTGVQYTCRLTCKPVPTEDGTLKICVTASLYDSLKGKNIFKHTETHLWDTDMQIMLRRPK